MSAPSWRWLPPCATTAAFRRSSGKPRPPSGCAGSDLRQKADNLTRREALGKAKAIGAEELKHARDDRENAAVALAAAEEERNALAAVLLDTGLAEQPAVRQAAANVRDCWLALQRTTVLSPAAGQIAKRGVQAGEVVSPGTPLMTVIPLHRLWIDANFKEVQLHKMRIGQPAVIRVDMYGGDVTYHGRVTWLLRRDGQRLLPPAAPERHRQLDQESSSACPCALKSTPPTSGNTPCWWACPPW